jgi:hypothetical protein
VPYFKNNNKFGYLFPKPSSFISSFLDKENAYSNKKIDINIYSIKAPNFK